jgi:hypothetical protein
MTDLSGARWRKSTFSMGSGDCVEIACLDTGKVAVRDSKDKAGPVLMSSSGQWQAFIASLKAGEFDLDR